MLPRRLSGGPTGSSVECVVTLHRRRRGATIAGSSDTAILLDVVKQSVSG